MQNYFKPLIAIALLLFSCKTQKDLVSKSKLKPILVSVINDGNFCDSCYVRVLNQKVHTNELGQATFFIDSAEINITHTDFYVQSLVNANSHFTSNLLIKPIVKIKVNFADSTSSQIRENIQSDISKVLSDIERIRNRVNQYKKENPDTNIDEFLKPLIFAESDINSLGSFFDSLEINYANFEYNPSFHNWGFIKSQRKRLNKINKTIVSLDFKIEQIDAVESKNEEANNNLYQLDNDLYFDTGDYEIESLSEDQQQNLNAFKNELVEFDSELKKMLDNTDEESTYGKLQVIGYTDGQPFESCKRFKKKCSNKFDGKYDDPCNMCLSYLRANTIGRVVTSTIDIFESEFNILAKGSSMAVNQDDVKELRKTEFSYIISFKYFNKSILDQR